MSEILDGVQKLLKSYIFHGPSELFADCIIHSVYHGIMIELLSPAGSLEKLKVALSYGADAVYLGGQKFGLRAASENFTNFELMEARNFANLLNKKLFVVLNGFLHEQDLKELGEYCQYLEEVGIDAVIVSDLGVVETVKKYSNLEIHLSTQASILNTKSAQLWGKMGAKRVILGREVSLEDAAEIKNITGLEVEMFIHGSMCMAYSGNCVISNYTAGRDSNRGGCSHSCRFEYSFEDGESRKHSYFMSSKDLLGIEHLGKYIAYGIDSIKVEGRMKGPIYTGTVSKIYSEAIKKFYSDKFLEPSDLESWKMELAKTSHRDSTDASLIKKAGNDSVFDKREEDSNEYKIAAYVVDTNDEFMVCDIRYTFTTEAELELVPYRGKNILFKATEILALNNSKVEKTRPSTYVKMAKIPGAEAGVIIRQRIIQ